ncbi:MAG TPA: cellulose synthase operon protein YhjQ/BcsQ [Edaphobacter sp.]|nr:cellulose synthase operon protein YhjQ/BcsQ [Edaphobacter sp.]
MMDSHDHDIDMKEDRPQAKGTCDSSELHSWTKLHGDKHRDFSAARRETRAPMRHHATQQENDLLSSDLTPPDIVETPLSRLPILRPLRETDKTSRTGGVERRKGVRRVEAVEVAEAAARHEGRGEIVERQDARDTEFDQRHRPAAIVQDPVPQTSVRHAEENAVAELEVESMAQLGVADAAPAWLYAPPMPQLSPKPLNPLAPATPASVGDTLQSSRERVASRWFALKGVFEEPEGDRIEAARQKETRTPVLAVYSLAGGVGKTSLVATVGRCLSSMGEKVLLTDTTSHGLLPFYFGASELQHDTVRTFSPPSGSTDAPVFLVSHEMEKKRSDVAAEALFVEEVLTNSQGMHRILLDLAAASSWVIGQMARMNLTVLVPVAPDMNSVISLGLVEKFFSGLLDGDARPLQPFYLLNQFDPSLPLHLDVREVLRRKLGDRLLPFVIRRAPAVSEALAEGMTVVDYAPDNPIAEDYLNVATWLRSIAAPATAGFRNVRWTEG